MSSHLCTHCNEPHEVPAVHKENLSKHKLTMLQMAAGMVIDTHVNSFTRKELMDYLGDVDHSFYGNWQKLRYHGLIAKDKKNPQHWLITRQAWEFLRGQKNLPKFVLVQNNHIKERSEQLLNVKDVYRGSTVIETSFEYFDEETGRPVGIRPLITPRQPSNQLGLSL